VKERVGRSISFISFLSVHVALRTCDSTNPHMLKVILVTFVLKGDKTTPRDISASRLARNKIPTAILMFSGSNFSTVLSVTLPDKTGSQKSKMAAEIM